MMAEFTERNERMLEETHDTVIKIKTVLLGTNGDTGLVGKVDDVCESHFRLKRNFWLLIGFLIGSGILAGSLITAFGG